MEKTYYTIRETAKVLGCTTLTVRNRIKSGSFPSAEKMEGAYGGEWRIPVDEVQAAVVSADTTQLTRAIPPEVLAEMVAKRVYSEQVEFTLKVIEETAKQTAAAVAGQISQELVDATKYNAIENAELRKELTEIKNMLMKNHPDNEKKSWWKFWGK